MKASTATRRGFGQQGLELTSVRQGLELTSVRQAYSNGDYYEGSWRHGQRSGKGRLEYATGEVYVGEFRNNLRHGVAKVWLSVLVCEALRC